jgi:hypothetical protein
MRTLALATITLLLAACATPRPDPLETAWNAPWYGPRDLKRDDYECRRDAMASRGSWAYLFKLCMESKGYTQTPR